MCASLVLAVAGDAGASARARTRDGRTPPAVAGEEVGKRSKKQAEDDAEMRAWLSEVADDEDDDA